MRARPLGATIGARVQRHAFAGMPYRRPFRGAITGTHGRTVRVRADDGNEYDAEPAELTAEGARWPGSAACTCCPRGRRPRQLKLDYTRAR